MKTLGNILWHIPFLGFVSAAVMYLIGLLLTATVIAAPVGLGLMEFGKFLFAPFSNTMVSKSDLNVEQNKAWKAYSTIVMVCYFPFGLLFTVVGALQVLGLLISIVGIPVGLVVAKSLGTYLNPVNKKCVPAAVGKELERRKDAVQVEKHLGPAPGAPASIVGTPSASGDKLCPSCAETVKAAAKICRYCRYEFPDVPAPAPAQEEPATNANVSGDAKTHVVIGAVAVVAIAGVTAFFMLRPKAPAAPVAAAVQSYTPVANAPKSAVNSAAADAVWKEFLATKERTTGEEVYAVLRRYFNAGGSASNGRGDKIFEALTVRNGDLPGELDIAKTAVARGANVNGTNGVSPLYWSVVNNKAKLARYLIERGADVNGRQGPGQFTVIDGLDGLQDGGPDKDWVLASLKSKGARPSGIQSKGM